MTNYFFYDTNAILADITEGTLTAKEIAIKNNVSPSFVDALIDSYLDSLENETTDSI